MGLLAVQPYVKVLREIENMDITCKEEERKIHLYHDRLVTKYHEFLAQDISDISFKQMGDAGGLLYIHTNRGIFSYTVHSSPDSFIKAFRMHIKKDYF